MRDPSGVSIATPVVPWASPTSYTLTSNPHRCPAASAAFTAARNVLVERNYIGDVRRATFDFEPMGNTAGVTDVVIRDNVIGRGRLLFVAAAGTDRHPPVVISIGPATTAVADRLGIPVTETADPHSLAGMVQALVRALQASGPPR